MYNFTHKSATGFLRSATALSLTIALLSTCLAGVARAAEPRFKEKDFAHWLQAGLIAQAAYAGDDEMRAQLAPQGLTLSHKQQLPGLDVGYTLATDDASKKHLLVVRGTANIKNAIIDAAFVLVRDEITGIDIHQGFLLSARDIYQQIKPLLKPGYSIDTVGHSLGGAAALILAMMLDAQRYTIGEVITFGQPKVTNISGSRKFEHLKITRLVTARDIVPLVPPIDMTDLMKLSIFWHQGTEVILYADDSYAVLNGIASMRRGLDFINDTPSEEHLNNHFMTTYIDYLKAKLQSPRQVEYKSDFSLSDWFSTDQQAPQASK